MKLSPRMRALIPVPRYLSIRREPSSVQEAEGPKRDLFAGGNINVIYGECSISNILVVNLRKVFSCPAHFNNPVFVDPEISCLDAAILHQMTGRGELVAEKGLADRADFRRCCTEVVDFLDLPAPDIKYSTCVSNKGSMSLFLQIFNCLFD